MFSVCSGRLTKRHVDQARQSHAYPMALQVQSIITLDARRTRPDDHHATASWSKGQGRWNSRRCVTVCRIYMGVWKSSESPSAPQGLTLTWIQLATQVPRAQLCRTRSGALASPHKYIVERGRPAWAGGGLVFGRNAVDSVSATRQWWKRVES